MRRLVSCLLLVLILASGCGQTPEREESVGGDTGNRAASGNATKTESGPDFGGRIVEPMLGDAINLIPSLSSDAGSHAIARLIYVGLLRYDKNIQLEPWAAESFQVLDGGKLLRFHLRKDIRWADGTQLTARDVEFTYKLMIDPKTPTAYSDDFKNVKEFKVIDDYTIEVRYDQVFARALVTWAHDILPRHLLEGEDLTNTKYSREPVGAGPYRLREWKTGERIVLDANPDYFLGRPYLDEAVYRIIPDQGTQFLELQAGNLDYMGLTPNQYLFQTKGGNWDENYRKYKYLAFGYTYLGYNLEHPIFRDKRVRQALAHAIDKEEIVKGVLFGLGMPAIGPYKPGTWVYDDRIVPYAHDPARAKAMLAEAGWKDTDGDGVLDKDGKPFEFTIITNQGNDQRVKTATIIQERLRDVGIRVRIRTVEWAAFLKEFIDKGNFDATILAWNILQDPDIHQVWHSSNIGPRGLNFIHYRNEELDQLLEKGRRTLDQAERKKIYDRVQEILHEDQPYCFLYYPYELPIIQARFRGVEPAPAGIGWNFERWWVPKAEQRFSRRQ